MRISILAALICGCVLTSACSTTQTSLPYDASQVAKVGAPAKARVEVASVSDNRKHDANWLGAIRGGYGNPLKTLVTSGPVKDEVKSAFIQGLAARGLTGAGSTYTMHLDVEQFDCNQYVRREAHVRIDVSLMNKISGQMAYRRKAVSDLVTGSLFTLDAGMFADVEDLRKVANAALQEAIDQVLNDPVFVALFR
jgi:hypothetical protein